MESDDELGKRKIQRNGADISQCQSLVLDGQQRLTSLWQGLMGLADRKYYVRVVDLNARELVVTEVGHRPNELTPKDDLAQNSFPLHKLYDPPCDGGTALKERLRCWCEKAIPRDSKAAGDLEDRIKQSIRLPLREYKMWFARFTELNVDDAARIFTQTNSSSVKVSSFDLAVAQALELRNDIRLRHRIKGFFERNPLVKFYFHQDEQRWIPEIGEWMLKVACLKIPNHSLPPKNGNFEMALRFLFENGTENADRVESNLVEALRFIEENGVPNRDLLPRIPPVYVIAGLQDDLQGVDELDRSKARGLLSTYLWRSFFSDRYEAQANDRLCEDFRSLRADIEAIKQGEHIRWDAPVFDAKLVSKSKLFNERNTFTSKAPMGNAVIAMSLSSSPEDWVTGDPLTVRNVRDLDKRRRLDRHHVFPRAALINGDDGKGTGGLDRKDPYINHGLNIVLMRKPANIRIGGKEPAAYMKQIRKKNGHLTEKQFKNRIESHIGIHIDELTREDGKIVKRYVNFLKLRAETLWREIDEKTKPPRAAQP